MVQLQEAANHNIIQAAHQYNQIQQILEGLSQLSSLWSREQTRYKALWGLQEYCRLASALCFESISGPNASTMIEAAATIISGLLEKIESLLSKAMIRLPSRLSTRWMKIRPLLNLGPPAMSSDYYLFGLLLCTGQLGTLVDLELFHKSLNDKLEQMIIICNVPEYRWKAVSVPHKIISVERHSDQSC